jgi:hypothetical protein
VTEEKVSVSGYRSEIIEAGTYPATLAKMNGGHGDFGPYAQWVFQPEGFSEDTEVSGFTTISAGRTSKGMEWARRILGKSDATDMSYGRDIKDKRPVVDWGEDELKGKPCRIEVEKKWDEDYEEHKNKVVNVLPAEQGSNLRAAQTASAQAAESYQNDPKEDFEDIPF